MTIKFLTLYARDIYLTANVYECVGLRFDEEQHGSGPIHLASETGGQVLEIYPGLEASGRSAILGFEVDDLEEAKRRLENVGAMIVQDIAVSGSVHRLIASDPEGRELFVQEAKQAHSVSR